jgi:hypothetical protein
VNAFARWFWPILGLALTLGTILFFGLYAATQKSWGGTPEPCIAKQKRVDELKKKGKAGAKDLEKAKDEAAGECYCERVGTGMIKQPSGTWSSLAFCFVGLAILGHFWSERKEGCVAGRNNPMMKGSFFAGFYGVVIVLMGPGAMAFHATMTQVGGWLDLVSMVLFASFIVAYDVARLIRKLSGMADWAEVLIFALTYAALAVGLSAWLWIEKEKKDGGAATTIFILSGVLAGVIDMTLILTALCRNRLSLWAGGRLFVLALIPWLFSQGVFGICDPDALFQWHAVWHLVAALFAGWIYLYFRTEDAEAKASEWETRS